MFVRGIKLRNFRCFDKKDIRFDENFIVIQGENGSGKSSLLEALHYCCYLRSFRAHLNRNLIKFDEDFFFLEIDIENDGIFNQVQVGFSNQDGKVVKCSQKPIKSYRELVSKYQSVTLCADDIALVGGIPEKRRDFLNYSMLIFNPDFYLTLKNYKRILEQRNSLLRQIRQYSSQQGELLIWSESLWTESLHIQLARTKYLKQIEKIVNELLAEHFDPRLKIELNYVTKNISSKKFSDFWNNFKNKGHTDLEFSRGRSFYGAHLDDFEINFYGKRARIYASRGQQKLIIFLIKIAQLILMNEKGKRGILLLDDFLTDFDNTTIKRGVILLKNMSHQVFLTCPTDFNPEFYNLDKVLFFKI